MNGHRPPSEGGSPVAEQPRWLDPDEQRTWRAFILATNLLLERFEADLRRDASMSTGYYEILSRLSEATGGRLRMSELADLSQFTRSHLSHTVARLEQLGWVRRELCPSDRRGAFATLTDHGYDALEAAAPVHARSVQHHLFDQLTGNQREQLRAIAERLLHHLAPDGTAFTAALRAGPDGDADGDGGAASRS